MAWLYEKSSTWRRIVAVTKVPMPRHVRLVILDPTFRFRAANPWSWCPFQALSYLRCWPHYVRSSFERPPAHAAISSPSACHTWLCLRRYGDVVFDVMSGSWQSLRKGQVLLLFVALDG